MSHDNLQTHSPAKSIFSISLAINVLRQETKKTVPLNEAKSVKLTLPTTHKKGTQPCALGCIYIHRKQQNRKE